MILRELEDKKLISPPSWLHTNTQYLCVMGSIVYGVAEDTSDYDVIGYCVPPKSDIFPYSDKIYLFDKPDSVFEQYQEDHIKDPAALGGKGRMYDLTIYSIVKYFYLCFDSNPNMVDSLFAPQSCILHSTKVSELVRDNRKLFLSKKLWPKFKGYFYSQLHKAKGKNYKKIAPVLAFENKHNISNKIKLIDLKQELERRGISIS